MSADMLRATKVRTLGTKTNKRNMREITLEGNLLFTIYNNMTLLHASNLLILYRILNFQISNCCDPTLYLKNTVFIQAINIDRKILKCKYSRNKF